MIVNITEAETNLSTLIHRVERGEQVVIMRDNRPIADLVVHPQQGKRKLGLLAGKFTVPDDFNAESDEINTMFYGNT